MNKEYFASVAHLDRVTPSEGVGNGFESHQEHQIDRKLELFKNYKSPSFNILNHNLHSVAD